MHGIASITAHGGSATDGFGLHAPDGFLTVPIALVMWAVTIVVLAIAVRETNRTLDDRAIPLMGVMAAFIFAAQMFNFQIPGGTSGHLLGGVLAAVLLGPWAGTLVMTCVVSVQALVFQDGGLVVLGANIFNMGVIGTLGGYCGLPGAVPHAGRRIASADPGGRDRGLAVGRRRRRRDVDRTRAVRDDAARDRSAGHGRRARGDRHRRSADHDGGARLHRRDARRPLPAP